MEKETFHHPVPSGVVKRTNHLFLQLTLSPPLLPPAHHLGDKEMEIKREIHHRHQQANISNSIFKLNIVRFMHTKMREEKSVEKIEIYSANIHPKLCTFSPKLEYLIINRISSFFQFLFLPQLPFRTVNKSFFPPSHGNKWSFFLYFLASFRSTHFHVMLYFDRYILE
jgi:hypothetical protein